MVKDFEKQMNLFKEVVTTSLRKESGCAPHTPTAADKHRLEVERQKQFEEEKQLIS